jgi:hypothetical protein
MSRRTKLLIAALFLVLLSIPVGYILLTWSPANPLRFRLIGPEPSAGQVVNETTWYEIEVRNTSCVDIQMFDTNVISLDPTGKPLRSIGTLQTRTTSPLYYWGYTSVPAYGTIRSRTLIADQDIPYITAGDVRVNYNCVSQTRHLWMNVQRWISKLVVRKAPVPFQEPSLEELNSDTDMVELAPATDAPP